MLVYHNRETGEVFESRAAALKDAADEYDFEEETMTVYYNRITYDEEET